MPFLEHLALRGATNFLRTSRWGRKAYDTDLNNKEGECTSNEGKREDSET